MPAATICVESWIDHFSELCAEMRCECLFDEPLSMHTSFAVGRTTSTITVIQACFDAISYKNYVFNYNSNHIFIKYILHETINYIL